MPTPVEVDPAPAPGSAPLPRDRCLLTVLTGVQRGQVLAVDAGAELLIGRGDGVGLRVLDPGVSWVHARIRRAGEVVTLEDLRSTNGTYLGSDRIVDRVALPDDARIGLGRNTVIRFSRCDALELEAALEQYDTAIRDPLTRLYNRGYFDERIESEVAFAHRHQAPLSLLMLDLDHFKRVNDRFGHPVGDVVLKVVTAAVRRMLRPEDVFARYGGEEFMILLREVTTENALILARRIRERVEGLEMPWEGQVLRITVSIGVTGIGPGEPQIHARALLELADRAMYEAKARGRNRVVLLPAAHRD